MKLEGTSIAVYVCTHKRNEPLKTLLTSVVKAANVVQPMVKIAVVVVDDNPDQRARSVVDEFDGSSLQLGLHYETSGAQNISLARNVGIEKAIHLGDWIGMVDDDQVVSENWFVALLEVQAKTKADAVTGPVFLRYPENSSSWLTDQPISEILEAHPEADLEQVSTCSTGNSIIRSQFLIDNPQLRFLEELGVTGGEDMVFYKTAMDLGLKAHYSSEAVVFGEQPDERSTAKAVLRSSYWMGNSEYLTNIESGSASRGRMVLRASKRIVQTAARPFKRMAKKEPAQFHYSGVALARSIGIYAGALGIKVPHH